MGLHHRQIIFLPNFSPLKYFSEAPGNNFVQWPVLWAVGVMLNVPIAFRYLVSLDTFRGKTLHTNTILALWTEYQGQILARYRQLRL